MSHCSNCGKEIDDGDDYCSKCGEKLPKRGCFIATACYGIESDEVKVFRAWRDNTLLKSNFGKHFVDFYYNVSPPIARFIQDKPFMKKIVRAGLSSIKKRINK
jgi:predicted amidophosphoribosyltransferase